MFESLTLYFGNKVQFRDAEIDIIREIDDYKLSTINKFKLQSYLKLEEILSDKDFDKKLQWYKECLHNMIKDYQFDKEDINDIHDKFDLSKETITRYLKVLLRDHPKKRTLILYGKSNSGKSIIANTLLAPFSPGMIQRAGSTNVHWLEAIYQKNFILWEEPTIDMTTIEDVKLLTGSETIVINRKNKNLIERLAGPAVLVTTNTTFWNYRREELLNRCIIEKFYSAIEFKKTYNKQDFIYYIWYLLNE